MNKESRMAEQHAESSSERALLVSLDTGDFDAQVSLEELAELARSAGAEVRGSVLQRRSAPDSATCIGAGRLEEIRQVCQNDDIDLLIFDRELTATQHRNLEDLSGVRVVDRTTLILDIFAGRAHSAEGRLQVELAQLQYLLPRLAGQGTALSRLGGGIGTRGPGETQLETDRRHIRRRIGYLKNQLEQVKKRRALTRQRREKEGRLTVALVGYTNAGKSTLMNALTAAGVLAEDRLFATLDPTARALRLPDGREVLLVDTVGLVRRLPHQLVEAFHSTLEEAAQADAVLNVCDAASPEAEEQLQLTEDLLRELRAEEADRPEPPTLRVYNKCDLLGGPIALGGRRAVAISAATGVGLTQLLDTLAAVLPPDHRRVQVLIPFREGALAERCRRQGAVEKEQFIPEGVQMTVTLGLRELEAVRPYLMETPPENGAPSA